MTPYGSRRSIPIFTSASLSSSQRPYPCSLYQIIFVRSMIDIRTFTVALTGDTTKKVNNMSALEPTTLSAPQADIRRMNSAELDY